jgi:hypothetical protein
LNAVRSIRDNGVELLSFSRTPSAFTAARPVGNRLRINIIGNLGVYKQGLDCLVEALNLLSIQNIDAEITYIGNPKILKSTGSALIARANFVGFLKEKDRDRVMSQANVSFLPGPFDPPAIDARSRYSIPSRILDFFAVATPIVGVAHPQSAAGKFLSLHDMGAMACCTNATELAMALRQCLDPDTWSLESAKCARAFQACTSISPAAILKARLRVVADESEHTRFGILPV